MPDFLLAAQSVLNLYKRPLTVLDIVEIALRENHLQSEGRTPVNTMRARISEHIRKNGMFSVFKRVGPNKFALRVWDDLTEYPSKPFIKSKKENVVCIKSTALNEKKPLFGFSRNVRPYLGILKQQSNLLVVPKNLADSREDIKQLVSYVLIRDVEGRILSYVRGRYSTVDTFLKGVLCIGFGGHVKDIDFYNLFGYADAGIFSAADREVNEELKGAKLSNIHLVGVINDDSSLLGLRHFAFVFEGVLPPVFSLTKKAELSVNKVDFLDKFSLWKRFHELEFWSQLLCKALFPQPENLCPVIVKSNRRKVSKAPILIVGEIGSGKTEISTFLSRKFNVPLIFSRTCVADIIKIKDFQNKQRANFQQKSLDLLNEPDGLSRLASTVAERIRAVSSPIVIVDGIRHLTTFELLKECFPQLLVIYVDSPRDLSYFLFKKRCGRDISISEFRNVREHPVEKEISLLRSRSDVYVFNGGTLKQLYDEVSAWWRDHVKA